MRRAQKVTKIMLKWRKIVRSIIPAAWMHSFRSIGKHEQFTQEDYWRTDEKDPHTNISAYYTLSLFYEILITISEYTVNFIHV